MFSNLSERLGNTIRNLTGRGRLTEENIQEALREVRNAFLEADVALPVIKTFLDDIQQKAIGQEVLSSLRPGDALIKVVYDELVKVLGETNEPINLQTTPPAVLMTVGLQGCGKTTTIAKLARWLKDNLKKKVLVVSSDVYRPAAIQQLETLAAQVGVDFFPSDINQDPVAIAQNAIKHGKTQFYDAVIIDTAGRLHVDQEMMDEMARIHGAVNPIETLLVVDSMMGQDAVNTAKAFSEKLPLTGVILTKTDGDARGGAALSMRIITGKPIKFIGSGEKIDALEQFYPDRVASRILGMGDILSLVEEAQRKVDHEKAKKMAKKVLKGRAFDFEDFKEQLEQMRNMGGITGLLGKLPGMGNIAATKKMVNDDMFVQMEAIINSMTMRERRFPAVIKGSHKQRIAKGSGTQVQDVNRLLRQFDQMQKMMQRFKGPKMGEMLKRLQGMGGLQI